MTWDPLGRFHWISNGAGVQRRYVFGPGEDAPLVWYEGAGLGDRRFLLADERGSIMAWTNAGGGASAIYAYDEYGIPNATALPRFGYTGQAWIPELGLWHYKARMYSPTDRFCSDACSGTFRMMPCRPKKPPGGRDARAGAAVGEHISDDRTSPRSRSRAGPWRRCGPR